MYTSRPGTGANPTLNAMSGYINVSNAPSPVDSALQVTGRKLSKANAVATVSGK